MASTAPPESIISANSWSNPLDILPPEIWEQIFLKTLPTPSHFKAVGFNKTEFVEFDPNSVLVLTHISRYLRQLVISCSILWTCLPSLTGLYRAPTRSAVVYFENRFNLMNLFVKRAQNLPLHVTLVDDIWAPQTSERSAGFNSRSGIASFFPTSNRWKSLTIYFTFEDSLVKYGCDLATHSCSSPTLPILDTLSIRQHKTNMTYLSSPVATFYWAPKLKHIQFIGMDIDNLLELRWDQITSYDGAVQQFSQLHAAANTVEELILKRNFQHFGNPENATPFRFTKLTRLKFDNISFVHKLPLYYGNWREDGTVLRWIEAPILESLEITGYQALEQAPSIIDDITMAVLRVPHDSLRHITFHVGGLTRQSLVDLLHSTSNLDTLDLWGATSKALSALTVNLGEGKLQMRGLVLAPKLRQLIIREWQDADGEILLNIFDSRRSDIAAGQGVCPLELISLVYRKHANCRKAQDSIEGWGDERAKVFTPGSEYQKIHGYSTHLAKLFLKEDSKRNPKFHGILRPTKGHFSMGDPQRFLEAVGKHKYSDSRFVEMSRLRAVLGDIRDQVTGACTNEKTLPLPGTTYADATHLLLQTADTLLDKWAPLFLDKDMARRWTLTEDHLTLKLDS